MTPFAYPFPKQLNILSLARWFLILLMIALLFSPPLVNFFELSLFGMFIVSRELRDRLLLSIKQPLVFATLTFYLLIFLATIYSIESWHESLKACWGWRKILLLPISVALFDDEVWKTRLAMVFIQVTTMCAALSFITTMADLALYRYPVGIIIRNHATQGIMFSVAAFSAGILLLLASEKFNRLQRWALILSLVTLVANVVYVTPGRSGYLALLVLGVTLTVTYMYFNKKIAVPVLVFLLIPLLLLSSPTVRQRISQGTHEAISYKSKAEATSMGIRMLLWKNTVELIRERPLLGYGTGSFQKAYKAKIINEPDWEHNITHDPHNQYLKIVAEYGFVGFMVFLGIIYCAFRQKPLFIFYSLGIGVLLVWCGNSFFSSHFSTFSEGRFIFLWAGVMLAKESFSA